MLPLSGSSIGAAGGATHGACLGATDSLVGKTNSLALNTVLMGRASFGAWKLAALVGGVSMTFKAALVLTIVLDMAGRLASLIILGLASLAAARK